MLGMARRPPPLLTYRSKPLRPATHRGKDRAIRTYDAKKIHIQLPLCLPNGYRLGKIHDPVTGIVDQHVDAPGVLERLADGALDRSILGDVEFEYFELQGLSQRLLCEFPGRTGVVSANGAHGGKDVEAFPRQGLRRQPPEAAACAGDQDYRLVVGHVLGG